MSLQKFYKQLKCLCIPAFGGGGGGEGANFFSKVFAGGGGGEQYFKKSLLEGEGQNFYFGGVGGSRNFEVKIKIA